MRWSIVLTSSSDPSAVCVSETPSLALRMPWVMLRIDAVIVEAMARPAASSFALLMRLPVDSRSIAVSIIFPATREPFCARKALELVLITVIENPFPAQRGDLL